MMHGQKNIKSQKLVKIAGVSAEYRIRHVQKTSLEAVYVFLGVFAKLRKATINVVMSAWNKFAPAGHFTC